MGRRGALAALKYKSKVESVSLYGTEIWGVDSELGSTRIEKICNYFFSWFFLSTLTYTAGMLCSETGLINLSTLPKLLHMNYIFYTYQVP